MAGYLGSRPVIVQVDGYQREESESRYVNVSGDDFSGHLDFVDDAKARFGSSDELHIYTESSGSGHSYIQGDNIVIRSAAGTARLTVTSNDVDVSSGALKVGGTTVIDSSREGTLQRLNVTAATGLSSLAVTTNAFTIGSTNDYNMAFDPNEIQARNNGAANDLILQKNGGSVGIGTSSPVYPLVLQAANPRLQLLGTGTNTGISGLLFGDADTATRGQINYNHPSDSLDIVVNAAERMRITSSGSVGIGTSSPSTRLTVGAGVGSEEIRVDAGAGWADLTLNSNATNGGHIYFNDGSNAGEIFYYHPSDYMVFSTAGTERMRITSAGSVGIGTSSPQAPLHVQANPTAEFSLWGGGGSFGRSKFNIQSVDDGSSTGKFQITTESTVPSSPELLTITNAGNVGIGTSSPSQQFHVESGTDQAARMRLSNTEGYANIGANNSSLYIDADAHKFRSEDATTEYATITSSGSVGIGTSSPQTGTSTYYDDLVIKNDASGTGAGITLQSNNTNGFGGLEFRKADGSSVAKIYASNASGHIGFNVGSEAMRLDASGNLLVGQSSTTVPGAGNTTAGTSIRGTDGVFISRTTSDTSASALQVNKNTGQGAIINIASGGTTVGFIGNIGTHVYIGGPSASGLFFGGSRIQPMSNGSLADNLIDMGHPTLRFDDIYATNGTIQTSDRNEKQDIESLSDAEQRVAVACKGLMRKFRWRDAVAEKGDEARTHFGIIAQDLQAAFVAEGLDAGDYAMFISSTWTDEDTGEERTRMGVRYSELLAFIIGAL